MKVTVCDRVALDVAVHVLALEGVENKSDNNEVKDLESGRNPCVPVNSHDT